MPELEPAEPRVKKESTPKNSPRRAPRVGPVESSPLDPMLFAGLNDTLKRMAQEERRHRVSNLKFV